MNIDKVVGEVSQGNGCDVVLDLFREGVRQSGETARRHSHAEIVPLDIAGVDVFWVGVAGNGVALATNALGRAVALFPIVRDTVNLHQHRVVHIARKRLVHRLDVHLESIAGKLNAIRQTACKVFDEIAGAFRIALADQPARYQLGIGVNRGPEPRISRAGVVLRYGGRYVLLLGVAKRPALINLHPFTLKVLENPVLVLGAECANLEHQPHDGLFGSAGYANGGADGVAFNQATDDLGALIGSEPVHTSSMPDGSRIVKTFEILFLRGLLCTGI